MLYPNTKAPALDQGLFMSPTSEYRGAPFWSWNCKLTDERLCEQIDMFKKMGIGGFHMHSRTGMATPYLSDEFMDRVKTCVEKARKENMLAWLYDEDRWPSGAAGGLVTKDEKYRARYVIFTPTPYGQGEKDKSLSSSSRGARMENGVLLATYAVNLSPSGELSSYRRADTAGEGECLWYAYLEHAGEHPWYNNEAYLDTLSPEAVQKFVETTHERYKQAVGKDFGGVVPAIFTDEPQFARKSTLGFAHAKQDVCLPWTGDFPETFKRDYGFDLLDKLPEVIWELPEGEISEARYDYHDHVSERFAQAFADTVGGWCKENGIALTGHMMEEPTLHSQTAAIGDCMRSYRSFQLPGIDILCDRREFTTAKQAQSAANQYGWPGVLSELYGVTGWDFDFRGHKLQGDWQAALGVTVRVHHLTWLSMAGEAKRDYPASIGDQSPWWEEYPLVENHFARLNTALTRGKNAARVGVVHPVESYWLHFGPSEQTELVRGELDAHFQSVTDWLLRGMIDFDFICESTLPAQCPNGGAPLTVGRMAYDAIIVPVTHTLRSSTVERLEKFHAAGGQLIFLGEPARYVDVKKSDRVKKLWEKARHVPPTRLELLESLKDARTVDVRGANGAMVDRYLHQMRVDGDNRWLYICHSDAPSNADIPYADRLTVRVRGNWKPTLYDTMTGAVTPVDTLGVRDGFTEIPWALNLHDSVLFLLEPADAVTAGASIAKEDAKSAVIRFPGTVPVALSEPNVVLLDTAQYRFDGDGEWMPEEEILRIDNVFRDKLGYPSRMEAVAQPWVVPDEKPKHTMWLKFSVPSEIEVASPKLAVENAANVYVILNGQTIKNAVGEKFTDRDILTLALPALKAGENELIVGVPISRRLGGEWMYLLGDFGVRVQGTLRTLTAPVRELGFGDWVPQGLPHYGGNVTYKLSVDAPGGKAVLAVPQYRGGVIGVTVDGEKRGMIAYAPYELALDLAKGHHEIGVTCYGHRFNCFGAVHNADDKVSWHGPNAWRSKGVSWCYEYRLKKTGILISPTLTHKNG